MIQIWLLMKLKEDPLQDTFLYQEIVQYHENRLL